MKSTWEKRSMWVKQRVKICISELKLFQCNIFSSIQHTKYRQYTGIKGCFCYFSSEKWSKIRFSLSLRFDILFSFRVSIPVTAIHNAVQHCSYISRHLRFSSELFSCVVFNSCSLSPPARFSVRTISWGKTPCGGAWGKKPCGATCPTCSFPIR